MVFSEKLAVLRRQAGLSQEQLADRLGVTRQSVSKWEGGAAMPELGKLISLSELFGVSVDHLVKDSAEMPDLVLKEGPAARLEEKVDDLTHQVQDTVGSVVTYTSEARFLGLPLICVRIGRARQPNRNNTAVGIVAVGNFAVGAVSIGLISAGGASLGMLAFGALALGMVSGGAVALGISTVGLIAGGASAIGLWRVFGITP